MMFIRLWYGSVNETYLPPCDTWKYALAGLRKKSRTGIGFVLCAASAGAASASNDAT